MNPNHPIQELSFLLPEDTDKNIVAEFEMLIEQMEPLRDWVVGPPEVYDQDSDDSPGGYLGIYSALRPLQLPHEVDERHFQEATLVAKALQDFSKKHKLTIELFLDHTFVGAIQNGKQSKLLREGLFEEWEKGLQGN